MERVYRGFIEQFGLGQQHREAFDASGTDTYQMTENKPFVLIDNTLGHGTVYLPPVAAMFGKIVLVQTEAGTNNTVVKPYEHHSALPDSVIHNGSGAQTSQTLASDEAYTVLLSTGRVWIALAFDLSI